ncbi:hypothetical protein Tco_0131452, partial [Tanacetum coccineum]
MLNPLIKNQSLFHHQLNPKRPTDLGKLKGLLRYLILVDLFPFVVNEIVTKEQEDIMERAATTASSLEAEEDNGSGPRCEDTILGGAEAQTRFETASKQSNDPPISRVNTLGSGEDILKLKELIDRCTKLSDRVVNLETTKTAQAKEIAS